MVGLVEGEAELQDAFVEATGQTRDFLQQLCFYRITYSVNPVFVYRSPFQKIVYPLAVSVSDASSANLILLSAAMSVQ